MTEEPFATRRELDMLIHRVDSLDRDGTRGVLALQTQVTDSIKDMLELKADMTNFKRDTAAWFEKHGKQHEQDMRDRITSRRWMIGTSIAGLLALATIVAFVVQTWMTVRH